MDTPWEHELERALVSQLASVRLVDGDVDGDETDDGGGGEDVESDVESDVEDVESVESDADARDDDRAAQLDELTALASIFGDDLGGPAAADAKRAARALEGTCSYDDGDDDAGSAVETSPAKGLLRFHLDVEPESYDPKACADADRRGLTRIVLVSDTTSDASDAHRSRYSTETFHVTSLPAVRLSVIFPRAYPSAAPPAFALSAAFLPRAALERGARALRRIWDERGAGETAVVFSWVEYLRERALREAFARAPGQSRGDALLDDENQNGWPLAPEVRLDARDGWWGRPTSTAHDDDATNRDASSSSSSRLCHGVPSSRSPDEALVRVLRGDALARARRFARAGHRCGVCFADDVPGTDMRRCDGRTPTFAVPFSEERSLDVKNERGSSADDPRGSVALACDHAFCADCVRQMCVLHVTEGTVGALRCPEPACGAALAPAAVRDALTGRSYDVSGAESGANEKDARERRERSAERVDETRSAGSLYERYEKLSLERGLDAMADLTYCPRCEHAVLEDEDGDHCAQCARCLYAFCSLCREGWHPGSTCLNPERRLQVLESRARGAGDGGGDEARRKHREAVADAMAHRYVEREGKRCPTCGAGVVKSEGCNKMRCGNCDAYFCYKCGDAVIGYEHFREGGKCSLFDVEAIAAWEREMNAGLVVAEARERDAHVAGLAVSQTRCPACRQPNFKLGGNNHIGCWSCGQHYCHACRSIVRRGADTRAHYGAGAGKCRQHTVD